MDAVLKPSMSQRPTKNYSCYSCGTIFKTGRSLSSHKYKFHSDDRSSTPTMHKPYSHLKTSAKTDLDSDVQSNISSINDDIWDVKMETDMNKLDIEFLQERVKELRSLIFKLDTKVSAQYVTLSQVENEAKTHSNKFIVNDDVPKALIKLENRTINNANAIKLLEDQHLQDLEDDYSESESESYDIQAADLIDDMVEIKNLFSQNSFERINSDIPKFRQSVGTMLKTLNFKDVDNEDVQLLNQIANSSKAVVRQILRSNFTHLVNIFKQLSTEFAKVYETEDDQNDVSEDEEDIDSDQEVVMQADTEQEDEIHQETDAESDQELAMQSDTEQEDETQVSAQETDAESDTESDKTDNSSDESEAESIYIRSKDIKSHDRRGHFGL